MTVKEALEKTIELLNSINVPVGLIESVAVPIRNATYNLLACIEAIEEKEGGEEDGNADIG